MKKIFFYIFFLCVFLCMSCNTKKNIDLKNEVVETTQKKSANDYYISFDLLHNYVIDSIVSNKINYDFLTEGSFYITGNNDDQNIDIVAECKQGTDKEKVKEFLIKILGYVGEVASKQVEKLDRLKNDKNEFIEKNYVFHDFDLNIDITYEDGTDLIKKLIKKNSEINID